ncbi:cardiolipin synthase [Desulfovibrio ferrophilus]|uniref:Cardiolipin synthase n=1 Tax=Desulfovibrio ferrophilus TaxID=241368 RepID=A0A2Z6B248_9BACT|nr:cardiolipin synthase [Desulfovibrio ferrophilus]BBD09523.1 phospholipase D/Transphosphatidylase [Desulfovibrio ferrophilus]
MLFELITAAYVVIELLGIFAALHAVMRTRTSQGAVAWAVCLVTFPVVSLPIYWIFGRARFHGYLEALRQGQEEHVVETETIRELLRQDRRTPRASLDPDFLPFERLAGLPFTTDNRAELLQDGTATFRAMLTDIRAAQRYVLLQYYIIRDDELGRELADAMKDRARAGIRVHLLYDEIGCHALPGAWLEDLRAAGIEVEGFGTTRRGWANRFQLNFRNHRKITVIDGRFAYVGGHNVGDEYRGRTRRGPWRDTHLRVCGPLVRAVQAVFMQDWYWATHELIPYVDWSPWEADDDAETGGDMLALPSGPADDLESCALMFVHAINMARERIWISSPYFVPDLAVVAALQAAALRGVDVRILLPRRADHVVVQLAGYTYLPQLDLLGVSFYRYGQGFLHQKAFLVDDRLAGVGTANLDNRSMRLNFELTLLCLDPEMVVRVREMFKGDFEASTEVRAGDYLNKPLPFRVAAKVSRLLAPVL